MNNIYFCKGVTLIELVISIIIITISIGGITTLFFVTTKSSADPMIRAQQLAIAQSYMDEILMQPYLGDGSTSGRANYNEVDDYNAITAGSSIQDQFGNPITALSSNYTISVIVSSCTNTLCGTELNTVAAKKIVISVAYSNLGSVSITAYKTDY